MILNAEISLQAIQIITEIVVARDFVRVILKDIKKYPILLKDNVVIEDFFLISSVVYQININISSL